MTGVLDYLARLLGSIAFWVVILPWQQGLRVRAGRHVRLLQPGIYLKVPALDVVKVESIRRRTSMVPVQTLSTADGATVVVAAAISYAIGDLARLYGSLHHAEDTIVQAAQGCIAVEVLRQNRAELVPAGLCRQVNGVLAETFAFYGLTDVTLHIVDFAFVRAVRLIQEQRWIHGRALDTQDAPQGRSAS
jgi:hypothetical protein